MRWHVSLTVMEEVVIVEIARSTLSVLFLIESSRFFLYISSVILVSSSEDGVGFPVPIKTGELAGIQLV